MVKKECMFNLAPEEVEPTFDNILVQLIEQGVTPGGLHIPDTVKDNVPRGRVLKVGPGAPYPTLEKTEYRQPCVKPGDVVLIPSALMQLGDGLYLIRDRDIPCKLIEKEVN